MDGPTWTKLWEGLRLAAYDDSTGDTLQKGDTCQGTPTIGYGETGMDIGPGTVWTQEQAEVSFQARYHEAQVGSRKTLGLTSQMLGEPRLAVLTDIAYNAGIGGLAGFVQMLRALRQGYWETASAELRDSRLGRNASRRTNANAEVLRSGVFPAIHPNA